MVRVVFFVASLFFFVPDTSAQTMDRGRFQSVYSFVGQLGSMDDYLLKDIIDTFKSQNYNEEEMTYAIYAWIAKYIAYDCHAFHHKKQAKLTASAALQERKAIGEGYASLFQAMCDVARINCVTISGYAKTSPEGISEVNEKQRHTWNAVKIKNTWYYVDVTWGAGYTDLRKRIFTPEYSDAWLFTNRDLFSLSHYPDQKQWHFEDVTFTKGQYMHAPVIGYGAVTFEIYPSEGLRGRLRGREKTCKPIIFEVKNVKLIKSVAVEIDAVVIPAEYSIYDDELLVEIPFTSAGNQFVKILVNSKPAYQFKAEVTASRTR